MLLRALMSKVVPLGYGEIKIKGEAGTGFVIDNITGARHPAASLSANDQRITVSRLVAQTQTANIQYLAVACN